MKRLRCPYVVAAAVASDRSTSLGAGQRDRDDLAVSYRALSKWLARQLVGLMGRGDSDVEDMVHESFVRFGRYEAQDRNRHPKALLLRIAYNVVHDRHRAAKVRIAARSTPLQDIDEQVLSHETDPGLLIDLKRAIIELPPSVRETFLLARFTPMTNDEIAERLGISTKTVEWRISRAVTCCMQRLDRERGSR